MPNLNTDIFLNKARLIHGDKYDYSKIVYTHCKNKIEIICRKHGVFHQTPTTHLKGCGCQKCGLEKTTSYRKYNFNEDFFEVIGPDQAWLLGFIFADGSIKNNTISISQSGLMGKILLENIKEMVKYNGKIYCSKTKWRDRYSLYLTSKKFAKRLRSLGVLENKTFSCPFPKEIQSETFYDFIRGYIDGDGCVGVYNSGTTKYLLISWVGTKEFIEGCFKWLKIKPKTSKLNTSNNLLEIRICGKQAIEIGKIIWERKNLPSYYKEPIWKKFMNENMTRYTRYDPIKSKAIDMFKNEIPVSRISKDLDVSFQTIYRWRDKWNLKSKNS